MNELERLTIALKSELLPCPFCGWKTIEPEVVTVRMGIADKHVSLYYYKCRNCLGQSGESPVKKIAYWKWQKRTEDVEYVPLKEESE